MKRLSTGLTKRSLTAIGLAVALVTVGCDDDSGPGGDAGADGDGTELADLTIAPLNGDFGQVEAGAQASQKTFTVANAGSTPSGELTVTIEGQNSDDFSVAPSSTCGPVLVAGASCQVTIGFGSATAGDKVAQLRVAGKGGELVTLALTGKVVNPPAFLVSPGSFSFGQIEINTNSGNFELTVTNSGGVASGKPSVTITGTHAAMFSIVDDECSPLTAVEPAGTCKVTVRFSPTEVGLKTASLNVSATPGATGSSAMSGNGVNPSNLSVTPSPANFGEQLVGSTSNPTRFEVKNTGGVAVSMLSRSISGNNPDQFSVVNNTSTCQATLAAGATCFIDVVFAPSSAGSKLAFLSLSGEPDGSALVSLSGTGLARPAVAISPLLQNYGTQVVNTSSTARTFTITNSGGVSTGVLTVAIAGADASSYSITSDGCSGATLGVGSNSSCQVQVVFTPGGLGPRPATLTVAVADTDDDIETPAVTPASLNGTGISSGSLVVATNPANFDGAFGGVTVGQSSVPVSVTVTNVGGVATGILSAVVSGTHSGDFAATGNTCQGISLSPSATCTLNLSFQPSASGNRFASLVVNAGESTVVIELSGIGLSSASLVSNPANQDFGSVVVGGTSTDIIFTITNVGETPTTGAPVVTLTGAHANQFTLVGTTCNASLSSDGSPCQVTVRFSPSDTGAKTANLNITGGAAALLVPLTGQGLSMSSLNLTPTPQNFGDGTVVDYVSHETPMVGPAGIEFTLTNQGGSASGTLTVALTGSGADHFTITQNACSSNGLGSGLSCKIHVVFSPLSEGVKQASIHVTSTQAGNATAAISGTAQPKTSSVPLSKDYGNAPAGVMELDGHALNQIFKIKCTAGGAGTTGPTIDDVCGPFDVSLIGANAVDFEIRDNGCDTEVDPGDECEIDVQFRPRVVGSGKVATLNLVVDGDSKQNLSINLTGSAINPLRLVWLTGLMSPAESATHRNFGNVVVGSFRPQTFKLYYDLDMPNPSGNFSSYVSGSNPGSFSVLESECLGGPLVPGGSCEVDMAFVPHGSGALAAILNLSVPLTNTYPAPTGTQTVSYGVSNNVSGTGILDQNIVIESVSPAALSTVVGTGINNVTVTIRNTGAITSGTFDKLDVTPGVMGVTVNGTPTGTCKATGATLASGASCTLIFSLNVPAVGVTPTTSGSVALEVSTVGNSNVYGSLPSGDTDAIDLVIGNQFTVTQNSSFGSHPAGGTESVTFTVANVSQTAMGSGVSWALVDDGSCDSTHFAIDAVPTTCSIASVPVAGTCNIVVKFTSPDQAGGSTECKILNVTNIASSLMVSSGEFTATALGKGQLEFVPSSNRYFGAVATGSAGTPLAVKVRNKGSYASGVLSYTLAGSHPGDFVLPTEQFAPTPAGETRCTDTTDLGPNESCVFMFRFSPAATGARSATFEVEGANDGDATATITLSGLGLGANLVAVSPSVHNFGPVAVDAESSAQTFNVANNTQMTAVILDIVNLADTDPNTNFTIVTMPAHDCGTGNVPASCAVQVRYTPKSGASGTLHGARLRVGGTTVASLEGIVLTPPTLAIAVTDPDLVKNNALDPYPMGVDESEFVNVGDNADVQFTLTNSGDLDATGVTLTLGAGDGAQNQSAEYQIVGGANVCATVAKNGGTCTFTVRLTPTSGNAKHAGIIVTVPGGVAPAKRNVFATARVIPVLATSPDNPSIAGTAAPMSAPAAWNGSTPVGGRSAPLVIKVEVAVEAGVTGELTASLNSNNFEIDWAHASTTCDVGDSKTDDPFFLGGDYPATCDLAVRHAPKTSNLTGKLEQTTILTVTGTPGGVSTETITAWARPAVWLTPAAPSEFCADVNEYDSMTLTVNLDAETDGVTTQRIQTHISGAGATSYGIEEDECASNILTSAGTKTCEIVVGFVPLNAGAKAGVLNVKILTDDGIEISRTRALDGTVDDGCLIP